MAQAHFHADVHIAHGELEKRLKALLDIHWQLILCRESQVLAKLTLVRTVLRRLLVGRSAAYYPANGSTQGMLLYADLWLNVTGAPQ